MPFLGTTPTQGFVGANPKQSFTANGSTTVFTLTNPVASANDLEVFVGNVRQEPTTAYTAAGTTLTMSEAPDTGLNFYVINKSQAQVTTTPPVNSISTDKILNDAVTGAKIENNPTIAGNLTVSGNTTASGTLGVTGDLTVDGNTLHVDSANNKVGLGVDPGTMPSFISHAVSVINGGGIGITSPSSGDNRLIFFGTGTSSSDVQLAAIKNTTSDIMFLGASGVEKARILNSGGISFNGDTAAANGLDDYEEGTWTANLIGSSANPSSAVTVTGYYTKIGQIVYVNAQFSNFNNSGASGGLRVNGLPFTASPGNQASGNIMVQSAATWAGTNTANISPYFQGTLIGFYASQAGGGWFEISHNTTAAGYLSISGTYKV